MRTFPFMTLFLWSCILGGLVSVPVHAAEVSFVVVPSTVPQDTASVIEVRIHPEGEMINAVEGVVGVSSTGEDDAVSIVLETGGSLFSLWPVPPTFDSDEGVVRFTGGTPENITEEGMVFRMRIFSKKDTDMTLSWLNGSAYRGDGSGASIGISSRSLRLALTQNEPNLINPASADSRPPRFESLIVSQDPDVFEGKYFISFNAIDDVSGVVRYEVVENHTTTEVTNGIYVLMDQERRSKVVVIAYDQAGNSTSVKVPTLYTPYITYGSLIILGVLLVWIVWSQYFRVRYKKS
jgi:hypothetical protein